MPRKRKIHGDREIPNFRKDDPPQTILGMQQKSWFLEKLQASKATWKIWGNSIATLEGRVDAQSLPVGLTRPWPGSSYGVTTTGDYGSTYHERAEIYSAVRKGGITGFVTVSGNSHSFWAGLAAPSLPPHSFEPVGVAFVGGAISSPTPLQALQSTLAADHPLRLLYLGPGAMGTNSEPIVNFLLRHGVRACLEYQRTRNLEQARRISNRDLAPHLAFVDLDGHGYAERIA